MQWIGIPLIFVAAAFVAFAAVVANDLMQERRPGTLPAAVVVAGSAFFGLVVFAVGLALIVTASP